MTAIFKDRDRANIAVEKLKAYAQPQRLMILSFLVTGEHSVGEIDTATGIGQPALSQQLAELRRAELVKTRRASKQIWYRLADKNVELCVRSMEAILVGPNNPGKALDQIIRDKAANKSTIPKAGTAGFAQIL